MKGILKLVIFIGFFGVVLGVGIYALNFTGVISLFSNNNLIGILSKVNDIIVYCFQNPYLIIMFTMSIILYIINYIFNK